MKKPAVLAALLVVACSDGKAPSPAASTPMASASPAPQPTGVGVRRAFPALEFRRPTNMVQAADGRFYVTEQEGVVRAFVDGATTAPIVLDLRGGVDDAGNEMGLLGLALHPKFATNGELFVNYTTNAPLRTHVSRFRLRADGTIDPAAEQVLLEFDQPFQNHNGGQLAFGPDGFLYVGTGDGGSGGDPAGNGQKVGTLLGKLLRIDVDRTAPGKPYAIPADNPFLDGTKGRPEVFAWGLRNLWRFSFDPANGRIWGADVGQNLYEEIDVLERGKNYGWNVMEASHCFGDPGCDTKPYAQPVAEYGRDEGQSVTGGYVYRGDAVPGLTGRYVYADYVSKTCWTLQADGAAGAPRTLLTLPGNPSSFAVDGAGELYALDHAGGGIYRFVSQ